MSSLAVGRGLEGFELWLAGLFSAAELAAADLLLQLSAAKGIADDDDEAASSSPSPRSPTPGCHSEDLTAQDEEERAVEQPAASAELDRRARKRYRLLSDLYAATSPVASDAAAAKKMEKKRKRRHYHRDGYGSTSSSSEESSATTRYGGDY